MRQAFFTKKNFLLWVILCGSIASLSAQSNKKNISRSAVNLTAGINYPMASVAGIPGVGINLSYVYVPIRFVGIGAEVSAGTMSGKGPLRNTLNEAARFNNEFEFSTQYTSYGIYTMLNLYKLFSIKPPTHVTPYFTLGASYLNTEATRESILGSYTYDFVLYASHVGMLFRIKTTKELDLLISGRYYITESYFLDGIPYDGVFDNFISLQAGISYKFGVSKKVDFIDWKRTRRMGSFKGTKCPRFY